MTASVTVVVLSFNSARYIKRCLESLERQDCKDIEVVVVDAGSADNTKQIVAGFDHRFRWLELPGSDMGMARNHGIACSSGRYIMFLDSDDCYLENKIARQVEFLDANPGCEVHFCSAWHYRTGKVGLWGKKRNAELNLRTFLAGQNENLNTMCMRRSVWDRGYRFGECDRGRYGEEWRLQLSMAAGGVRMEKTDDALVLVELRPDSHTTWSRQWIMKQQALEEVGRVFQTLTPSQRDGMNINLIQDMFRVRLVPALLIEDMCVAAGKAAAQIGDRRLRRQAQLSLLMGRLIPATLRRRLFPMIWIWRQNRSFRWTRAQPRLKCKSVNLG